jgi:hypothetical protein
VTIKDIADRFTQREAESAAPAATDPVDSVFALAPVTEEEMKCHPPKK